MGIRCGSHRYFLDIFAGFRTCHHSVLNTTVNSDGIVRIILLTDDIMTAVLCDIEVGCCVCRHVGVAVHIGNILAKARCVNQINGIIDGYIAKRGITKGCKTCTDASTIISTCCRHRAAIDDDVAKRGTTIGCITRTDACTFMSTCCRQRAVTLDSESSSLAANLYASLEGSTRYAVRANERNFCRSFADDTAGDGNVAERNLGTMHNCHRAAGGACQYVAVMRRIVTVAGKCHVRSPRSRRESHSEEQ